jgi:predicted TPR repeat methyltransferase
MASTEADRGGSPGATDGRPATGDVPPQADDGMVSTAGAVQMASLLHRAGNLDEAEILYRRVLEVDPEQPDALNLLGVLSFHKGDTDKAIELIRKSAAVVPRAEAYNNLGNVLIAARRVDDAVTAYEKALELAPGHADSHNNLGIIYKAQRRSEEAARAFTRAIEIDPAHVPAYNNYGNLLIENGQTEAAMRAYAKALELRPDDRRSRQLLASAYTIAGELAKAAEVYTRLLEEKPDDAEIEHLLAACRGSDVPERASDRYIEQTFDSFSKTFDAKLEMLGYRAPQLVADAFARTAVAAGKRLRILDAGCGTGLCGPLFAPYASNLDGVDLSAGMLRLARERGVYDTLTKSELTEFLRRNCETYDAIVSADTLIYFGVLAAPVEAAFGALRPGGVFVFSIEKADDAEAPAGHRINPHGRYSHTRSYLEQTLAAAGFCRLQIDTGILRRERGKPVGGLVATAHKPS